MSDEPKTSDRMIAALLREREGLVRRNLTDRVGEVDEQLKDRGYVAPEETDETAEPAKSPPVARKPAPKRTAG